MHLPRRVLLTLLALALAGAPRAGAQTIQANSLSHRSTGVSVQNSWRLDENGYLGTYFTSTGVTPVTIGVNAVGSTSDGVAPRLNLVVADTKAPFSVDSRGSTYQHTFNLPAGTYFLRAEFANDTPTANRSVTINNVSISGAGSVSNTTSRATNEANALAMADTYIEHFRQGAGSLVLAGATPGAAVQVRMRRNEFNFGTYVTGFTASTWVGALSPGETTTNRARYQAFVKDHFNMLVPSNMGKWQPTENTEGVPTMANVDAILNFAAANNLSGRMHNLIWGAQQPGWVNTLIANAQSTDPVLAAQAKADLRQAVIDRIAYYVGDGDANQNDGDRAKRYVELDVLNETLREGTYWDIFGAQGVAEFYKLTQDAVQAAGAQTRLYTNEYNVFNFANDPATNATDNYANWYRRHVEQVNNAGYGDVVTGVGIQYIVNPVADTSPTGGQNHNTARINQVIQNMAVTGLPLTLTEFSIPAEAFGEVTSPERAAEVYNETLRMMYGSPLGASMLIWEPWPAGATDQTTLVDANWNLTPAGQAFVALMDAWTTPDQTLNVGPDGTVQFDGFYGEYEVVVGGQTFVIDHLKGAPTLTLVTQDFLAGDYNADGVVNAADYAIWRDAQGTNVRLLNDLLGGTVGDPHFNQWMAAFGATAAGSARTPSAPEPATLAMLIAAVGGAGLRRAPRAW